MGKNERTKFRSHRKIHLPLSKLVLGESSLQVQAESTLFDIATAIFSRKTAILSYYSHSATNKVWAVIYASRPLLCFGIIDDGINYRTERTMDGML